jgi:hypothetical protein
MEIHKLKQEVQKKIRWLAPGLGVKRWLCMILLGTIMVGLGFAILLSGVYNTAPQGWWIAVLTFLSLQFLPRTMRALLFGLGGLTLILLGTWGLNRALLKPFLQPGRNILDTVSAYRKRERGPRIVAIGGGTGLSTLLRGLKAYSNNITAIVSVADDGGSSGELRRSMGVLPPGDIRSCLTAMADDENFDGCAISVPLFGRNG